MRGQFAPYSLTVAASLVLLVAAAAACSSRSDDSQGTDNSVTTGGTAPTTGGSSATSVPSGGGKDGTTSVPSSGGTSSMSNGGASPTGGTFGSGGVGTGGTTSRGGSTNTGGMTPRSTGGAMGVGGATSTGATALGGTTATGGTNGIGGVSGGGRAAGGSSGGVSTGGQQGGGTSATAAGGSTVGSGGSGVAGARFMPCPTTAGTACNIMPVGDSITEGCCTAPMGGYRIELYHQALTNKKKITFVGTLTNGPATVDGQTFPQHHEGHGGWKISQIAGVIDNAISSSKPHIVLLKIGTNDINGNDDVNNAPNRLESLINQITKDAPSALLVVSAIIPTTTDSKNPKMQAYNTAIKAKAEAAATAGKHVVFVDNYAAFTKNSNYKTALMADELHPNSAGYVVLGDSFYSVISALLPAAQ